MENHDGYGSGSASVVFDRTREFLARVHGTLNVTGPQRSYLHTLAQESGEDVPEDLTKAQASKLIDRLQQQTERGRQSG